MPAGFRSDRSWNFDLNADELWDLVVQTESYQSWWPWLRSFDSAGGFRAGETWQCTVAPPLPYAVRFRLHIDDVVYGQRVAAHVTGDISGDALLTFAETAGGVSARLVSSLVPSNIVLRSFGMVARPLVEWGHDWVLDQGQRQFLTRVSNPG